MFRVYATIIFALGLLVVGAVSRPPPEFADYRTASPQLRYLVVTSPVIVHGEIIEIGVRLGEMRVRTIKVYKGFRIREFAASYLNLQRDTEIYGDLSPSDVKKGAKLVFFMYEGLHGGTGITAIMDYPTFSEKSKTGNSMGDINDKARTGWRLPDYYDKK